MTDGQPGEERRHFTRIPIDCAAVLHCNDGELHTTLLDISLKGALLNRPTGYSDNENAACELELFLGETTVFMQGGIAHSNPQHIGFRCDHIDLESISHLKRLVELNLGDEAALERELQELVADD
jgi:hypothetical protein